MSKTKAHLIGFVSLLLIWIFGGIILSFILAVTIGPESEKVGPAIGLAFGIVSWVFIVRKNKLR